MDRYRRGASLLVGLTQPNSNVLVHDLRPVHVAHSVHNTRLVQRGVDLYKVQRLLCHKTRMTTQRYAHHTPESLRDCVLDEPYPQRVS